MKKFTFLLSLLLASTGVTASAQDTFVASDAPSDGNWADNTHWYIMKLDNKFVTIENVDENKEIKLTADNALTNTDITSGADQWCIVGDATTGYKFYNKKAGVNVVFGMTNNVSNTGGAARSKMYASTTTHSTETTGTGILFDIKTKNNVNNVYYVSLKDATDNRYWNQRDNYVSYWTDGDAYGNSGSQVRFYNSNTYWDSYWNLTGYQSWANNAPVGTTPFTYPQTAVNTFKSAIATVQSEVNGAISHATATAAAATLKTAKNEFRKTIYGPADNYVCKIKNPNLGRFIHASTTWTAGSTFPLNNSDNERNVVFVIEKNENGTYKIKSRDTGMYIKEANPYTSTATKEDATDFVIYGSQECDNKVVIGTGDNFSNFSKWFHANNANLITWEAEAPNSYWEFTPISDTEFAALADTRTSSLALMPGVDTNEASIKTALDAYKEAYTAESWKTVVTAVNNVLNSKFYRINNNRPDKGTTKAIKLLASDGGNKPKMYTIADGNKLVSSLWKFKFNNEGGFSLSNVNNPEKYVATLTNAAGGEESKTANDFTDEASAVQFTLSQQGSGWLTIKDQYGNILNGENAGNCPINYWNSGLGSEGAIWQINEVNTFDVNLNTVGEKSYATAYLPFGVSAISGAEAYVGTLNTDNTVLNMTQTTSVPAEKGFVLVGAADATATLTIGTANELNTALTGTLVNKAIADEQANYLVFGKNNADNTKVGFFKPTVETIPANKAYLDATGVAGAIAMNFGGNTTGVNTVVLGENGVNAPVFDLSGRRVVAPVKGGVYIQNGKKFIK